MSPKSKIAPEEAVATPAPVAPTQEGGEAVKPTRERRKKKSDNGGTEAPAPTKKAAAKAEPKESSGDEQAGKDGDKKRSFTVVKVVRDGKETEFKGGRYQSNSPSSAARKSANLACKEYGGDRQEIDIFMQETTKSSAKKTYSYHAVRTKVDEKDVSFQTGGGAKVSVPFKYAITVKALPKSPHEVPAEAAPTVA
jgi:hypothetical protein